MSLLFLPLKAATTLFRDLCNLSPVGLPRCNTQNHYRSVDAHFQNGAGSVSLSSLPQKAANTSFMDVVSQSPLRLPKMEIQKSLTLG